MYNIIFYFISFIIIIDRHLYVCQRGPGMVAETAHELAGVAVIVRVTPVRRVEAQFPTVFQRTHVLVHGIDGLQYSAWELFELAQLDRLVHAVVFQVVNASGWFESPLAGHRQPVHVRHIAFRRTVVVVCRSIVHNNGHDLIF